MPNLKADALTIGDALAIREGDAFAGFRSELRRSLDGFDQEIGGGHSEQLATEIFEERMRDASSKLDSQVRRSSLRDLVKTASIPAGLAVVSEALLNPLGPAVAGFAALGTAIGAVLWQWVLGRNEPGTEAGRRYCAMLGGDDKPTSPATP